jgi:hypothetical protein
VFVSRLGSPAPSAATASNSSNGGIINKSRRFIAFDFRLVPTFDAFIGPLVCKLIVEDIAAVEIGCGKSNSDIRKKYYPNY